MVARGQKVFHCGYFDRSRTIRHTSGAGAAMRVEPCTVRIADLRGTIGVVIPSDGGQADDDRVPV